MNKTEEAYSGWLELRRRGGEIQSWQFEAVKFRLADKTWYTPDFMVLLANGQVEFHEVKGHWEDDARVKVKAVAERYPLFGFVAVKAAGRRSRSLMDWTYEEFSGKGETADRMRSGKDAVSAQG